MHIRRGRYIGIAPLNGGLANACVVTADRRAAARPDVLLEQTSAPITRWRTASPARGASRRPQCLGPLAVESSACWRARACSSPATRPVSSIR